MAVIQNRMVNGGFEAGLSGWISHNVSIVSSPTNEGFYAAQLNGGALNSYLIQSVSVNAGDTFELILSIAREDSGTAPVTSASVVYYGTGNTFLGYGLIENISFTGAVARAYKTVYGTTTPAPTGTVQAQIIINRLPTTGTAAIIVDQIALIQIMNTQSFTIIPVVNRYLNTASQDMDLSAPVAIPAQLFTDDAGNSIAQFAGLGPNSYHNLFINGMLQEGNAYNVSPTTLTLNSQTGATIYSGTPMILEVVQFFIQST